MSAEHEKLRARVVAAAKAWVNAPSVPSGCVAQRELNAAVDALEALEAQEKPKYEALQGYEGDSRLWRVVCGGWLVCVFFRDDAEYAAHAYASRLNGVGRDTASERHAGHHEALRRLAFTDGVQRGLSAAREVAEAFAGCYPLSVFPEPPPGEHGRTVDACSARAARHVATAIAERIRALSAEAIAAEAQPKEREA